MKAKSFSQITLQKTSGFATTKIEGFILYM